MEKSDMIIGGKYMYNGKVITVETIGRKIVEYRDYGPWAKVRISDLEGIVLSPESLEPLGFDRRPYRHDGEYGIYHLAINAIPDPNNEGYYRISRYGTFLTKCMYVHEVQFFLKGLSITYSEDA